MPVVGDESLDRLVCLDALESNPDVPRGDHLSHGSAHDTFSDLLLAAVGEATRALSEGGCSTSEAFYADALIRTRSRLELTVSRVGAGLVGRMLSIAFWIIRHYGVTNKVSETDFDPSGTLGSMPWEKLAKF